MKIKTIEYSESHEYVTQMGLKRWRKSGMSAEIDESEDVFTCSIQLQEKVLKTLHKDNNPQLTGQYDNAFSQDGIIKSPPPYQSQPISRDTWEHTTPTIDPYARDQTEIAIDNAANADELFNLLEDAKKHSLLDAFIEKQKQFLKERV